MGSESEKSSGSELNETVRMVFIGDTEWKDKVWQQWVEIKQGQNNGDALPANPNVRMWQKLVKHAIVGAVYEFKGRHDEQDHLTVSTSGRFIEQWQNQDDRRQWQLNDRLIGIMRQARREFLAEEILEPVREAYQRTPYPQRQAFIAWLFQAIQRRS